MSAFFESGWWRARRKYGYLTWYTGWVWAWKKKVTADERYAMATRNSSGADMLRLFAEYLENKPVTLQLACELLGKMRDVYSEHKRKTHK